MGTGYVRQDAANNIDDGKTASAADIDAEFDALQTAFSSGSGHTHDGTSSEGGAVTVLGPAQEYVGDGTSFSPKTDDTYDLGTASLQWRNIYIDGLANLDSVDIDGGNIDGTTIGSSVVGSGAFSALSATATATFSGGVSTTNITASGTLDVTGLATFADATATGTTTIATADINGGSIDGTTIGASSTANGTFSLLTANSTLTANGAFLANGNTTLGNATSDTITVTGRFASALVPSTDNTRDLGSASLEWRDLYIDGTANIDSLAADTATISGTFNANGDTNLGNAGTDSITFTGRADSDFLPIADSTHDLGSSSLAWAEVHADDVIVGGESLLPVENTWTVEITAGAVTSATTVTGYYYTLGDIVFCSFNALNNINTSGMTGTDFIRISLPFTAKANYIAVGSIVVSSADSGTSSRPFVTTVTAGQAYAVLRYQGGPATASTPVVVNDINASNTFDINFFSMTYMKV